MEGDGRYYQFDLGLLTFGDGGLGEPNAYSISLHDDEGYASCMATHETHDVPLVASRTKLAACKKLHAHHGTNASSDAAGKVRRFHCAYESCGKEFSTSGHLARHNRIHTGEKNYACSQCGARFSRQDNCNQHAKSHGKLGRKSSLKESEVVSSDHKSDDAIKSSPPDIAASQPLFSTDCYESTRPVPSHTVSYANSLVTSEAGYASSSNEFEPSPVINQQYDILTGQFSKLPQSIFDQLIDAPPPSLVYDSSAAETDESYQSFSNQDFISEEDFYNWSAGVLYTSETSPYIQASSDI